MLEMMIDKEKIKLIEMWMRRKNLLLLKREIRFKE
jgi:hypothetical protein